MILVRRTIFYYRSRNGKMPFAEWMNNLDPVAKEVVHERIEKIKLGYFGDYKKLGDGVSELRFHIGSGYRIYYGMSGSSPMWRR